MGQKSLMRFNRLNVSMRWESELNTNSYHWLSTKLYIYLRLFIPFIFKVELYNFFKLWGTPIKQPYLTMFLFSDYAQQQLKTKLYTLYVTKKWESAINVLQIYLCRAHDLSYIYIIYTNALAHLKVWHNPLMTYKARLLKAIFSDNYLCY